MTEEPHDEGTPPQETPPPRPEERRRSRSCRSS